MEGSHKWALKVCIDDNPGSGAHPNQTTDAWRKKQGPQTVESQDLVSPRALTTNPKLTHNKSTEEKQLTTEDE